MSHHYYIYIYTCMITYTISLCVHIYILCVHGTYINIHADLYIHIHTYICVLDLPKSWPQGPPPRDTLALPTPEIRRDGCDVGLSLFRRVVKVVALIFPPKLEQCGRMCLETHSHTTQWSRFRMFSGSPWMLSWNVMDRPRPGGSNSASAMHRK